MFFYDRLNSIEENDKVLEIGPGGTPHPRSDEFLEIDPALFKDEQEAEYQRGSAPELVTDKKITYYDGGIFPFDDNSFDYVIASHVLEHVDNVELFISEMFRIGKKGYIEYPTVVYDYLYNIPVHLNFIHYEPSKRRLLYMKKDETNLSDFQLIQSFLLKTLGNGYSQIVDDHKDIMFEGFEWSANKKFSVNKISDMDRLVPKFIELSKYSRPPEIIREVVALNNDITQFSKREISNEVKNRTKNKISSITKKVHRKSRGALSYVVNINNTEALTFSKKLRSLESIGEEPFVMPFWRGVNENVKKALLPVPPNNFLGVRAIIDTMFVIGDENWLNVQINYLKKRLDKNYEKIVKEDSYGSPLLLSPPNNATSHNTIHHLYHQEYFFEKTKLKPSKIHTVVEWGGGYGNFAKLWMKRFGNDRFTYIIIDTSLFCSIQWLYLSKIFGKNAVNVITPENKKIIRGKFNLVPVAMLESINITGDLFVSTWGLSESAKEAQDYVKQREWFGCNHLLIGFQDSYPDLPYASRLGKIANSCGAKVYDIEFIPKNHYAIK